MGRPIYKDINGVDVRGSYANSNLGVRTKAYFGGQLHDCFIVNQKGGRSYVVEDIVTGDQAKCKLVNIATPNQENTMAIVGYLASSVPAGNTQPNGSPIVINKLQKRTAIDWSDNRYTWSLENDSSADVILLTPFA